VAVFVCRRIISILPILVLVSIAVFGLTVLVPGDAATTLAGGPAASEERIQEVRSQLGLDDPFLVQYGRWAGNAVQLDFGESLTSGRPVLADIRSKLPITLSIVFGAAVFGVFVGMPIGVLAGTRPGTKTDRFLIVATTLGVAVPSFLMAMLLVLVFSIKLGWFPAVGFTRLTDSPWDWLRSIVLPSIALGTFLAASVARQVRAELADVMQRAYIRTAWAKGASTWRVVGKHALKNASIPAITVIGLQLGALIGGTLIVEQIFAIPGLGDYLLFAILDDDLPVIMGVTTIFVVMYVVISLLVDIVYSIVNPKVRPT
jgi:peptide/nickel transport system permease protein